MNETDKREAAADRQSGFMPQIVQDRPDGDELWTVFIHYAFARNRAKMYGGDQLSAFIAGWDAQLGRFSEADIGATRLLVDTAFGFGGLPDTWGVSIAVDEDGKSPVLLFVERTPEGNVPLAEIHPIRQDEYKVFE